MSGPALKTVGEALYGPRWQSDLARDLGVSDRTMRRWADGASVPDGVMADLERLCLDRSKVLDEVAGMLKDALNVI